MKRLQITLITFILFAGTLFCGQKPREIKSDASEQERVYVTIYNSNRALVNEVRNVILPGGPVKLWFQDVAARIMPQTVAIKGLAGADFSVLEQNYEYDLLSPQKLLEKYLNREVVLVQKIEEKERTVEKRVRAKLLSTNNGTVWKVGNRIVVNPPYSYLEFPELPENLYAKPTLVWLLNTKRGKAKIESSYLTNDISWRSDYVFTLAENDRQGDMLGWVTINNNSGTTYRNAKLKLIAGDVNVVEKKNHNGAARMKMSQSAPSSFEEKAFFEYHMYTLQRPSTVNDRQQKQIELLQADDAGVEKQFILRGNNWWYFQQYADRQNLKVEVALEIENSSANGLGIPLPKGTVRVYKKDSDGSAQFIGEDTIDHTPKDEKFYLTLGNAFDVVAERRQTEYKVISSCMHESAYEIKIRNHKKDPIRVRVLEPLGGDWEMLSHSHDYEELDAFNAEFSVPVEPDEEAVLTYKVRVRWGC